MFPPKKAYSLQSTAFRLLCNMKWVMGNVIFIVLFFLLIIHHSSFITLIRADEVDDLQQLINVLNKAREQSVAATKPLVGQLDSLKRQLAQIQVSLQILSSKITQKEKDLDVRKEKLAQLLAIFNQRVQKDYKSGFELNPFAIIFGAQGKLSEKLLSLAAINENHKIINSISDEAADLLTQKEKLEKDKSKMAILQADVDKNATFLGGEIKKAQDYQTNLTSKIAELSARQQAILAAKSGTFTTAVGEVPLADDPNARPDFNPGFSPAFAAFSFGAYTHRNGMSQYGAKGRAEAGQSAEDIIKAYYPGANLNKNYNVPSTINVTGYGSMSFEDQYMMRIYEMPNSFPTESLKAQAVAARTYAVRSGGTICPDEGCQVYKNSDKGGAWADAVRATRGWVMEGGSNAQYSSTTGGYGNNSGWDTKCGNKNCWTGDAYEKIAGSPWFYKGWYKDRGGNSCGRSHPWLSEEQMSDILNSYIVYQSGSDKDRISPIDTSCWPGNPFSMGEMKDKANGNGGAVSSISGASVVYKDDGTTASVYFSTNRGSINISGSDFKTIFNLRAPGYTSIKSPLFNIEKK